MKRNVFLVVFSVLTTFLSSTVAQDSHWPNWPCPPGSGLERGFVRNITPNSADVYFPGYDDPPSIVENWYWMFIYGEEEGVSQRIKNGYKIQVDDANDFQTLTNLKPNTRYVIEVQMSYRYNGGNVAHYVILFETPQVAATLPYTSYSDDSGQWSTDEYRRDSSGWKIWNGALSFDFGANNQPDPSLFSYATTYRTLEFTEAGTYKIDFDWKFYKTSHHNFLRIFLSTEETVGIYESFLPDYCIAFDDGIVDYSMMEDYTWHRQTMEFTIPQEGKYHLFVYYSGVYGENYLPFTIRDMDIPAEITNIYIRKNCQAPVDLSISDITHNSAEVTWQETGSATQWEVQQETSDRWRRSSTVEFPFTLFGLLPNTTYEVSVRAVCAGGNYSEWSDKVSINTEGICTVVPTVEQSHFTAYPNPTNGELTITFGENVFVSGVGIPHIESLQVIEIYDNIGRLVETQHAPFLHNGALTINISHLPNGVYFTHLNGQRIKVMKK
jgi:hypothetical protein